MLRSRSDHVLPRCVLGTGRLPSLSLDPALPSHDGTVRPSIFRNFGSPLTVLAMARFRLRSSSVNVAQCRARLRSGAFDAVILDVVMPHHDGIEALRELKASFPEIKIVTVSGADSCDPYLTASSYLGADASLSKSKIASLCALLDVVLGG